MYFSCDLLRELFDAHLLIVTHKKMNKSNRKEFWSCIHTNSM